MTPQRAVAAFAVLGMAALIALGAWLLARTPGTLVNEEPHRLGGTPPPAAELVIVTVEEGDSARDVGEKLEEAGVIESARLFRVLVSLLGVGDDLVAGDYEFELGETAVTAVSRVSQGVTRPLIVTIPEGLRAEEIAGLLERRGVITAAQFRDALDERYEASFLAELPAGAGLEGFLFPATYGFSRETAAHDVVQQLLSAFDQRYREELLPALEGGPALFDLVVLASIVEREAVVAEERPVIASVFLNRLAAGLPLQADPTVQYAVAADPASIFQFGYWKQELTLADLAIDSPYNTYVRVGLPPGPIANPGLDSLLAVADPASTNYLFFVARPDGSHVFAETLEEHQRNVCELDPSRPEC
jgi:UPF0755 protein